MSTAKSADGAVIGRDPSRPSLSHRLRRLGPLPILILIAILIFASGNPRFLSEANITNVSQQLVYLLLSRWRRCWFSSPAASICRSVRTSR